MDFSPRCSEHAYFIFINGRLANKNIKGKFTATAHFDRIEQILVT